MVVEGKDLSQTRCVVSDLVRDPTFVCFCIVGETLSAKKAQIVSLFVVRLHRECDLKRGFGEAENMERTEIGYFQAFLDRENHQASRFRNREPTHTTHGIAQDGIGYDDDITTGVTTWFLMGVVTSRQDMTRHGRRHKSVRGASRRVWEATTTALRGGGGRRRIEPVMETMSIGMVGIEHLQWFYIHYQKAGVSSTQNICVW